MQIKNNVCAGLFNNLPRTLDYVLSYCFKSTVQSFKQLILLYRYVNVISFWNISDIIIEDKQNNDYGSTEGTHFPFQTHTVNERQKYAKLL